MTKTENRTSVECIACFGLGKIYDPAANDPVEGLKMARTLKCGTCQGAGHILDKDPRFTAVKAYYAELENEKARRALKLKLEEQRKMRLRAAIRAKLSTEERDYLFEYGWEKSGG